LPRVLVTGRSHTRELAPIIDHTTELCPWAFVHGGNGPEPEAVATHLFGRLRLLKKLRGVYSSLERK